MSFKKLSKIEPKVTTHSKFSGLWEWALMLQSLESDRHELIYFDEF